VVWQLGPLEAICCGMVARPTLETICCGASTPWGSFLWWFGPPTSQRFVASCCYHLLRPPSVTVAEEQRVPLLDLKGCFVAV
jgi:hypothetical protein